MGNTRLRNVHLTDGSQSETTKVVSIDNTSGDVSANKGGNGWLWLLLILPLLGFGGFWFLRRRLVGAGGDESSYEAVIDPGAYESTYGQTYAPHTPDWQQGIAGESSAQQPVDSESYPEYYSQANTTTPPSTTPFTVTTPDWQQDIIPGTKSSENTIDSLLQNAGSSAEPSIITNDHQYIEQDVKTHGAESPKKI